MGWGEASSLVIYGFDMGEREWLFDYKFIRENFRGIQLYATRVWKGGYFSQALYGMECEFNQETGQACISEEEKKEVMKLFNKYTAHLKSILSRRNFERKMKCITLGFHCVLSGDMETDGHTYITMTAKDKVEESEEEMDDDDGSSEEEGEEFEVDDDEDEDKDKVNDVSATAEEATDAAEDQQEPAAKRKKAAEDEDNETH